MYIHIIIYKYILYNYIYMHMLYIYIHIYLFINYHYREDSLTQQKLISAFIQVLTQWSLGVL